MNEFIDSLGKQNLIIILAVFFALILALIVILIIEKIQSNKSEEIEFFDNSDDEKPEFEEKIYYKEKEPTSLEAKKKLDEAAKKLVDEKKEEDNGLISATGFEVEQEEKSVISYDELVKISNDIDERNDILLSDEGDEPITIDELYKKHLDEQNIDPLDNPDFIDDDNKFKNSEVISPVFGVYKNINKVVYTGDDLDKTVNLEDLESEIRKTEEFLKELKKLKNKLD